MPRFFQGIAARTETWLQRHYVIFLCVLLGLLLLNELWLFGLDLSQWDFLLISGSITFVVGLYFALQRDYGYHRKNRDGITYVKV